MPSAYTRDRLAEVAAESRSINEMMRRLGVPMAGGTHSYLSKRLRHYGIDTAHFTHPKRPDYSHITHDRDAVAEAAMNSTSIRTMMDWLRIEPCESAHAHLKERLAHFGIDTSHFASTAVTGRQQLKRFGKVIPADVLTPAVERSRNVKGLILQLGLNYSSVTRALVKRSLAEHGLDTGHFTGSGHLKGTVSARRRSAADILRVYPPGSNRVSSRRLARALAEVGHECRCAFCGLASIWRDQPLILEIDHISGDWRQPAEKRRRDAGKLNQVAFGMQLAAVAQWRRKRFRSAGPRGLEGSNPSGRTSARAKARPDVGAGLRRSADRQAGRVRRRGTRARKAWPRWLMAFFCSGVSSAQVTS
jgi:hypothetical protein